MDSMRTTVSWPVATWVAPAVPTLVLWAGLVVGHLSEDAGVHLESREVVLNLVDLAASMAVLALGWLLTRGSSPRVRGAGVGMAAGAAITALTFCTLLAP